MNWEFFKVEKWTENEDHRQNTWAKFSGFEINRAEMVKIENNMIRKCDEFINLGSFTEQSRGVELDITNKLCLVKIKWWQASEILCDCHAPD